MTRGTISHLGAMGLLTLTIMLLLGGANQAGTIPKPLLVVSGAFFLACELVFLILSGWREWSAAGLVVRTYVTWLMLTVLFFSWLYRWDRSGWLWAKASGFESAWAESFPGASQLQAGDFVRQHPIFKIASGDSSTLILPSGEYQFEKTVVVPAGLALTISPGVIIRFGVGCSLISYGPIIAVGTAERPIVFAARHKWRKWGVVGVVGSDSSVFENTRFEDGRWALVNGVEFPGCLSVVNGAVRITNSRFVNLFGKDAVNVREGRVAIQDNIFENSSRDGLDVDGGFGEVSRNRFVNCGDEGIDLSENERLRVYANLIIDSRGGRIAADRNFDEVKSMNTLSRNKI